MIRRAFPSLLASLVLAGLAGCVAAPGSPVGPAGAIVLRPAGRSQKVAVLLPLTGPNAALGTELRQAVQLALGVDGPQLDVRDTAGTPTGATAAAQAALADGDGMILGPLTAPETAAAGRRGHHGADPGLHLGPPAGAAWRVWRWASRRSSRWRG